MEILENVFDLEEPEKLIGRVEVKLKDGRARIIMTDSLNKILYESSLAHLLLVHMERYGRFYNYGR